MNKKLTIVTISAEVAPFSKAGGLGDVARSLPKALKRDGHNVIAISPLHGVIDTKKHELKKLGNDISIPMDETKKLQFDYWRGYLMDDLPVYFIDRASYFSGFKTIYGTKISNKRFFFFNLAALKLIELLDIKPDIIHCNDWHTGLVPYFVRKRFNKSENVSNAATVYTIHNLAYQMGHAKGAGQKIDSGSGRLPRYTDESGIKGINFAKRAIMHADLINAVSEQYAKEIMTPKFGEDLNRILKNRENRVFGIVNGIDYDIFNPKKDPDIKKHYSYSSLENKITNKLDLQKKFKLPKNKDIPVLGMVTRITEQKGFDLLMDIADDLLKEDIQLVIAGTGEKTYENFFRKLQKKYPKKVGAHLVFDTHKAAEIYAGSDIFLMPSRFEPCGLGQLISMRYGSVPVVHAVGGLVDTVTNYDQGTRKGNGFVFKEYDPEKFLSAIMRSIETYKHAEAWKRLVQTGMKQSHSWEIPAQKYAALFRKAVNLKKQKNDAKNSTSPKNQITKIFDPKFVANFLQEKIPDFAKKYDLSDLTATPIKRNIGKVFYHIVVRFDSESLGDKPIFCSAHSQENRDNANESLKFINKNGFKDSKVFVPQPLLFDKEFGAFFYRGIDGENLLHYISQKDTNIAPYLEQAAEWIARLHKIPATQKENFNPENSRIQTVLPGPQKFIPKIKRKFPKLSPQVNEYFEKLVQQETRSIARLDREYLIHGDFHPENVIINATDGKVSVIDFTDICMGDWARDIGSLMQQLRYMSRGKRSDEETKKHQQIFVKAYLKARGIKTSNSIERRITLYRAWTALRSTIFFLTKGPAEPKNAKTELEMASSLIKKM